MEVVHSNEKPLYPQIQNYSCYRRFLIDFYNYKKHLRSGFSYRRFSALVGFKSPNYFQLLMKGERNLSTEMAESVAEAFCLKTHEVTYFISLVKQENSKSQEELLEAQKEGLVALKKLVSKQISTQSNILSNWYNLVIRELVFFEDFEPSAEYVTNKTSGIINIKQAQEALDLLIKGGFLIQKEGQWVAEDPVLDTGDNLFSIHHIQKLHSESLKVWSDRVTKAPQDFQELGLINIPLSKDKIPELKQKMRKFQDEIIGWLHAENKADTLVQLGVYMIPIVFPKSINRK